MARRLHLQPSVMAGVIALLVSIVFLLSIQTGWAERFENLYLDAWHRIAGKRYEPQHAALVMVDDLSLAKYADVPLVFWTPLFARAIETLRDIGARVVVLDFIFSGSPEQWLVKLGVGDAEIARQHDRSFRAELNRGKVVLAGYWVGESGQVADFILPSPDFLLALPQQDVAGHVGLANLALDADSVVRHYRQRLPIGAEAQSIRLPEYSLSGLAAKVAGAAERATGEPLPIAYAGPPGSFPIISFDRLLAAGARDDPEILALHDKVVIVGAGYAGMNDVHPTPYSNIFGAGDRLMSGAEIQANIVETLLSGREVAPAPQTWVAIIVMAAAGLCAYLFLRLGSLAALAVLLLVAATVALGAYWSFRVGRLAPAAQMQFAIVMAAALAMAARFSSAEREKRRLRTLFGRYVSPSVIEALSSSGEMPVLGGHRHVVTVLFSDIRDFTTLSESLAPEEVVDLLNNYFELACAALLAEEATIDKFIGDAVMAEFGAPLAQTDHADRALRAALALQAVATEFGTWVKRRFPNRDLPSFAIGIGIHTGPAVIGNIGSSRRMEYTAIGDTVNSASRLEGMTKAVGCPILASRETVAALTNPSAFHFGATHCLSVKGRRQEIEAVGICL